MNCKDKTNYTEMKFSKTAHLFQMYEDTSKFLKKTSTHILLYKKKLSFAPLKTLFEVLLKLTLHDRDAILHKHHALG